MATPEYMKWLPARTIERLGRLEFLARGTMDGFVSGRHRSARKGASVEFAQHREYAPGDDLRNLDWRLVARRQRCYVREYVDETNLRATILIDASGSMSYRGDVAAGGLSKFDYARRLAAALAYVLIRQQDAVGLVAFDSKVRLSMPPKASPSQLRHILAGIDGLSVGGESDIAAVLHEAAERTPRRSMVFIIGDMFGDAEAMLRALHHFRFRHDEVAVLHVLAEEEVEFPFREAYRFEDAESPAFMNIDSLALRKGYLEQFNEYMTRLHRGMGEMRVTHEVVDTSRPCEDVLSDILVRYSQTRGM